MLNQQVKQKNNPAKNNNINIPIDTKINIKYSSSVVYNEGENKMESQFNPKDLYYDIKDLNMVDDYNLLHKDSQVERYGYEKYFLDFKNNLLAELNTNQDDPLLGETKFVLFVAFDIIDAKPSFEDLVGIDPLNDYKKYILKIDTNDLNLFLVSGQIIYLEGELIENGKAIEVRSIKNGFKINEFFPNYEDISHIYQI